MRTTMARLPRPGSGTPPWNCSAATPTTPPTKRYTYGYGRAEDLGGLFVVAMITLSSVLAAYEGIDRLVHPRDVTHLWAVVAAALVGFAGNELVAGYRIRVRLAACRPDHRSSHHRRHPRCPPIRGPTGRRPADGRRRP
jgi:hypothetical protein